MINPIYKLEWDGTYIDMDNIFSVSSYLSESYDKKWRIYFLINSVTKICSLWIREGDEEIITDKNLDEFKKFYESFIRIWKEYKLQNNSDCNIRRTLKDDENGKYQF
jgi:hypothetical protein